jgi:chorismate mutase
MKQFTVRGLSKETERRIIKEARQKGISINRAIVSLLEERTGAVGRAEKKSSYHDLDDLFGIWTEREAEEFEKGLELQREVDEELWKPSD